MTLYENHFSDSGNNFSHSVVFTGSLDAMGAMYGGGQDANWQLFITRVNMQTEGDFSSAMGRSLRSYGDASTPHPVQKYFLFHVKDGSAHTASYELNAEHNPDGRTTSMGIISSGHSPDGVNRWIVNGFKDFKTAMAGVNYLRSDEEREAYRTARAALDQPDGNVTLVRSGLRIQLGQW